MNFSDRLNLRWWKFINLLILSSSIRRQRRDYRTMSHHTLFNTWKLFLSSSPKKKRFSEIEFPSTRRSSALKNTRGNMTLPFNKTNPDDYLWSVSDRGGGGGGRGVTDNFPRREKAVIKREDRADRSREIQLQSHTYCTRKSSWTIPLILQRRQTIANDTRCEFAPRYNCPVVGSYESWLPLLNDLLQTVADAANSPIQFPNFSLSVRF